MAGENLRTRRKKPYMLANLLIFGLLRRPQNTADIIHRAYIVYYWRKCRTLRSRLFVLWGFLISPVMLIKETGKWTIKMGVSVAQCSGKSLPRQIMEQFYLGFFFSLDSGNYYLQEFYQADGLHRARYFVNKKALKYGVYSQLGQYGWLMNQDVEACSLGEKQLFSQYCQRNNIPVVPILMEFKADGSVNDYRDAADKRKALPEKDLFCKPNVDKEGVGAEAWFWVGHNKFNDATGNTSELEDLKERLIKLASSHSSGSYLVQPFIVPHPDLEPFRKLATPTIRLITYIDPDGPVKADRVMLRFSRSSTDIVDNASTGGMVAPIDLSTGKLGPATEKGPECIKERWSIHRDNGAQIEGRQLPYWKETCALALMAHEHFPHRLIIGWDIIITSQGPLILEGNAQPGLCFLQKAHLTPLGKMNLGIALAAHTREAIKYMYSGIIGGSHNDERPLDLYEGSAWQRRLAWLRLGNRKSVHLIIGGKVQGIYYRKWLQSKARIYKVSGWVRNCSDSKVETVLSGKASDIEDLVKQCWRGPDGARVDTIKARWHHKPVKKGFQIIRGKSS